MTHKSSKPRPIVQAKVETETLIALATNDTVTAAAEQLGISRETVYQRIHAYGLTEKLKDIQYTAQVELMTGAGKAARNLIEKIDHDDPTISVKASTETLDRIGLTKPDKGGNAVNINFNQVAQNVREELDL